MTELNKFGVIGLLHSHHLLLFVKDYPHNLTKHEINGTSKIPIYQLFSELGKISKCYLGLYSKTQFFFFSWIGKKFRSPARAKFRNPKIPLLIGKNMEVQPKTNSQKIPILKPWMNWEIFCPNLSFLLKIT